MQLRRDWARRLRRDETDAEQRLWMRLRDRQLGVKFRRQYPIGPYITDFCCVERLLMVELDGAQHTEHIERDEARSAYLNERGFRVVRLWNHQVMTEMDWVVEQIFRNL
jgi:very-short-patch-repair endonuclease